MQSAHRSILDDAGRLDLLDGVQAGSGAGGSAGRAQSLAMLQHGVGLRRLLGFGVAAAVLDSGGRVPVGFAGRRQ